ncbi:hypothetical protein K443DRAFT_681449 [Laccaria amethystina LaAM-08-1]|uniref:Uncharacterized protein n=1 Tax=Laccaria amethystina LaAM-08-1 TaxID=1095629 RepID=A0A0C9WLS7_9AGAR|nr:hypothetical protein K443DRAFT_681449 [Laccaria amethystina LaAM-08-1]
MAQEERTLVGLKNMAPLMAISTHRFRNTPALYELIGPVTTLPTHLHRISTSWTLDV